MPIFEFCIPVQNLTLNQRSFKIGLVTFRKVSRTYQRNLVKTVRNITPVANLLGRQIRLNSTVCEINIAASNYDEAYKESISEIDNSINVLKLYRNPTDNNLRKYFGQVGEVISGDNRIIIYEQLTRKYTYNFRSENVGFLNSFILDSNRINHMKGNGFNLIHSMLLGNRNRLDQKIISAINWYGKSFNSYSSEKTLRNPNIFFEPERFLYCFTALESLLIPDSIPISPNLARRVAHLCEFIFNKRTASRHTRRLYRIRNEIIHDGIRFIDKQDFELLSNMTKTAIISLIKRRNKLNITTIDDLINWFYDKDLK